MLLYRGETFNPNFFYFSGMDTDHSFYLKGKNMLFVPALNGELAKKTFGGRVVVYRDPFKELKKHVKGKTLRSDFSSLNLRLATRLKRFCHLKDYTEEMFEIRAKKKKPEISNIKKAARLTREIFGMLDFKNAKTELDIERQLRVATAELGLEPAFDPIVATDSSSSFPHYFAKRKKLGSMVLIDYGLRFNHYCSDLTRCFFLDKDKKKMSEYEKLQDICHTICDELPSLRNGRQVAELSARLIERAGFPKPPHAIGHGVGLNIHEYPRLSSKWTDNIKGTVMAIEPAFYLKRYGMRFEQTIHFDGKKARVL